jgi:hypothetical protein
MQPQFNDEGAVPVGVPGALVLLPLALPTLQLDFLSTQVMVPGNVPSLQIQKCPGRL